jgi:hypothetical protein
VGSSRSPARSSCSKQRSPALAPSSPAPSSCSKLPWSKLALAQRLWSSSDGVRGGGVGRW